MRAGRNSALFANAAAGGWKGANTRLFVAGHDLTAALDRTVGAHVLGDMSSPGALVSIIRGRRVGTIINRGGVLA